MYTVYIIERDPSNPIFSVIVFNVETHNGTIYTFKIRGEGALNLLEYSKEKNGVVEGGKILEYDPFGFNEIDEESMSVLVNVYEHYQAIKFSGMI